MYVEAYMGIFNTKLTECIIYKKITLVCRRLEDVLKEVAG